MQPLDEHLFLHGAMEEDVVVCLNDISLGLDEKDRQLFMTVANGPRLIRPDLRPRRAPTPMNGVPDEFASPIPLDGLPEFEAPVNGVPDEFANIDGLNETFGEISPIHSGQEVQRISVINNLPDLLQDHHDDCMRRVVPKVREVLHVAQAEMQMEACRAFLQILQSQLVPLSHYTQTFLQTILLAIDSKDPDLANAWLETLLDVIELLPKDVIKREILGIAIAKGQLSQSVQSRLSCCRILGKIATKFEPFVIKKDILPVVQSLCQDVDYEVRGCMCRQLDPVARGLGLDATKNAILPELVELTNDEESYVRLAGLETVVNLLSLLDDETCSNTIVPLVCKFCQQAMSNEDSTLPTVAKQLGKLCHGLSANLNEERRHWFIDYYRSLCRMGLNKSSQQQNDTEAPPPPKPVHTIPTMFGSTDMIEEEDQNVECRKNAAYNFPAMVLFIGVRHYKSELSNTFSKLCTDPHANVRRSIACGFHEVVKLLGNNGCWLQSDLITLLNDDSTEVLQGIVRLLPETLETMARGMGVHINEAKSSALSDLIPAMLTAEAVIATCNNWRLQEEFITKLCCVTCCFTNDQIYHKIIPLLFRKFHTARALPVKHAVVKTLLTLLQQTRRLEQRNEVCRRLVDEVCNAQSFYVRGLFIDISWTVMVLFSRSFFKTHFFEALLKLAVDPVANIRLRICPMLPRLKAHLKLPTDRQLLQLLETNVRKLLLTEKDRDVTAAIQKAVEELDRTQVQMESLTKKPFLEDDIADARKEEEEQALIEQEEKEKREEAEGRSAKGQRKDSRGEKKDSSSKIPMPKKSSLSKIPAPTSTTMGKDKDKEKDKSSASSRVKGAKTSRRDLTGSPRPGARPNLSSASSSGSSSRSSRGALSPRGGHASQSASRTSVSPRRSTTNQSKSNLAVSSRASAPSQKGSANSVGSVTSSSSLPTSSSSQGMTAAAVIARRGSTGSTDMNRAHRQPKATSLISSPSDGNATVPLRKKSIPPRS